jgi:hypothetical protein
MRNKMADDLTSKVTTPKPSNPSSMQFNPYYPRETLGRGHHELIILTGVLIAGILSLGSLCCGAVKVYGTVRGHYKYTAVSHVSSTNSSSYTPRSIKSLDYKIR